MSTISPIPTSLPAPTKEKKVGCFSFLVALVKRILGLRKEEPTLVMQPLPAEPPQAPQKVMPSFDYRPSPKIFSNNDPLRARVRFVSLCARGDGLGQTIPPHIEKLLQK